MLPREGKIIGSLGALLRAGHVGNLLKFWSCLKNNCSYLDPMWSVSQSCPTLCNPIDCSPLGSSVHEVFQARVLEQAATGTGSSFRGSSRPRDWTWVSYVSCIGRWILYHWATWEAPRPNKNMLSANGLFSWRFFFPLGKGTVHFSYRVNKHVYWWRQHDEISGTNKSIVYNARDCETGLDLIKISYKWRKYIFRYLKN